MSVSNNRALAESEKEVEESTVSLQTKMQEYAEDVNKFGDTTKVAMAGVQTFTTIINQWQQAFAAAADLAAGNIDELVGLYNAQINAISSQNRYTQALALQATAINVYGQGSEQATRATTAANYVGALYTQSKKNEIVALNNYATATAKNVSTIVTSFTTMIASLQSFEVALTLATAQTLTNAQKVALAAIPIIGLVASLGITAYQLATSGGVTAPSMQSGGYVPKTGLVMLHQGETVIPKSGIGGGGGGMGNVEIHIHASSNVDLARVRQEVENALAKTMLQAQKQRGVYG